MTNSPSPAAELSDKERARGFVLEHFSEDYHASTIEWAAENLARHFAAVRESCAKIADKRADTFTADTHPEFRDGEYLTAREIASSIRASGSTK